MFSKLCRRIQNNQLECKIEKLSYKVSRLENDLKAFETKIRKERQSDKYIGLLLAFFSLICSLIIWFNVENTVEGTILGVSNVDFAANSAYAISLLALYLSARSTGVINLLFVMICIVISIIVTP